MMVISLLMRLSFLGGGIGGHPLNFPQLGQNGTLIPKPKVWAFLGWGFPDPLGIVCPNCTVQFSSLLVMRSFTWM